MSKIKNPILKFILLLASGGIVGAGFSMLLTSLNTFMDINVLASHLSAIVLDNIFIIQLLAWFPCVAIILVYFMKTYKLSKCTNLSDEEEDRADKYLSISTGLSTLSIVFIFSTFALSISDSSDVARVLASTLLFLISFCISSYFEIASIKLAQKLHPEKKGDPLNFKFDKDWLASCDEGEKMITYVAGFKTAMLMKKMFIGTFIIFMLIGLFVNIGILPYMLLGILWGTFTLSYNIYSYKLEKGQLKY